jgi:cell division septum initiation protein DivIVA
VDNREDETPRPAFDVTPTELRTTNLPLQPFGGYSRAETDRLLDRAAGTLEERTSSLQAQISELKTVLDEAKRRLAEEASRQPESVEQAVGEVLVTAHRVAEDLRNEANDEVDKLLADARAQARDIVEGAERRVQEIDEARVRAENRLAHTQQETRRLREDAERGVAELHEEARRVRLVIDEFRTQWWNLISDALKQLELRVPSADGFGEETANLHDDLRRRLGEPAPDPEREHVDSEIEPREGSGPTS